MLGACALTLASWRASGLKKTTPMNVKFYSNQLNKDLYAIVNNFYSYNLTSYQSGTHPIIDVYVGGKGVEQKCFEIRVLKAVISKSKFAYESFLGFLVSCDTNICIIYLTKTRKLCFYSVFCILFHFLFLFFGGGTEEQQMEFSVTVSSGRTLWD